jgi:hypothetical protein
VKPQTFSAQSPDMRAYHGASLDVQKFEMDSGVKIRRHQQAQVKQGPSA